MVMSLVNDLRFRLTERTGSCSYKRVARVTESGSSSSVSPSVAVRYFR